MIGNVLASIIVTYVLMSEILVRNINSCFPLYSFAMQHLKLKYRPC